MNGIAQELAKKTDLLNGTITFHRPANKWWQNKYYNKDIDERSSRAAGLQMYEMRMLII